MKGKPYDIIVPRFESIYAVQLPEDMYTARRRKQNSYSSKELYQAALRDENLRNLFTEEQLNQLRKNKVPSGYTWHHHVQPGEMQLVDSYIHSKTGHTGGGSLWSH